jgi:huntingtin interacting protein 1
MLYELRDLRNFKAERSTETDELRKQLDDEQSKAEHSQHLQLKSHLVTICESAQQMLSQCNEDLQNSSTISYPTHLAESALKIAQTWLQNLKDSASEGKINAELNKAAILFCHHLTESLVPCSAAAYTSSIEHYEPVLNQCKRIVVESTELYDLLKKEAWSELTTDKLGSMISSMSELQQKMTNLPTNVDIDVEAVGNQLQEEMQRMDNAIKHAVERIKEIQLQAQQKNTGARLAVNDKILEQCKSLMAAVYLLVERSRDLQQEIVDAGRGTAPPNEFYKRNHQWTKGLLSAAQCVGVAALELM